MIDFGKGLLGLEGSYHGGEGVAGVPNAAKVRESNLDMFVASRVGRVGDAVTVGSGPLHLSQQLDPPLVREKNRAAKTRAPWPWQF